MTGERKDPLRLGSRSQALRAIVPASLDIINLLVLWVVTNVYQNSVK
jgi:hypothetical protein